MVEVRAFTYGRPARVPAARSRLCAMAAMTSQAAFAPKWPDGRWAREAGVAAVTYGIDLDAALREVHHSNMSKLDVRAALFTGKTARS